MRFKVLVTNQSSGCATNNQGQPVSAGVYFYSIEAGNFRQTKKMILIKIKLSLNDDIRGVFCLWDDG